MTAETVALLVALVTVLGAWTATVVSLALWLAGRFRSVEKLLYALMHDHREEDDRQFREVSNRLIRLEIKSFGFSETLPTPRGDRNGGQSGRSDDQG